MHDLQKMFVQRSPFHIAGIITIVEFHGIFFQKKKGLTTFGHVIDTKINVKFLFFNITFFYSFISLGKYNETKDIPDGHKVYQL